MQELLRKIRQILKDRKTRQFLARVVTSIAAVVVFVTTYAMILPAISMEKTAVCGVEEHQHSDSCYEERLVCGQEESDGHHHDDSCYTTTTELNCVIPEHRHSAKEGCYDSDGNLICKLQGSYLGGSNASDIVCIFAFSPAVNDIERLINAKLVFFRNLAPW